jgi:hypothetical protein
MRLALQSVSRNDTKLFEHLPFVTATACSQSITFGGGVKSPTWCCFLPVVLVPGDGACRHSLSALLEFCRFSCTPHLGAAS